LHHSIASCILVAMKFIHPTFLWALLIIVIPIIIHLLNLRKFKPLLFPNVQFLSLVKEQTKKQSSVKRWVQLLLRCLAFAALIFAFAQPYFPASIGVKNNGKTVVCLYLDNSFSMQGKNETGNLFDQAKQEAINIVRSFDANTSFIFSSNLIDQTQSKPCDANKAIQYIQQCAIGGQRKTLDAIQAKHLQAIPASAGQVFHFYLSDFQQNQFETNNLLADSNSTYLLVDFKHATQQNVSIDSVWLNRPTLLAGSAQELSIRINNNTKNSIENYPITIWLDDVKKQQLNINVKANSTAETTCEIKLPNKNSLEGKISITDYPITFDNELLFALNIQSNLNVHTLYTDRKNPLVRFFESDTIFKCASSPFTNPNLEALEQANIIVLLAPKNVSAGLSNRIASWNKTGKTVVLLPDEKSDIVDLNILFKALNIPPYSNYETQNTTVNSWEFNHPIFNNVLERAPQNLNYPAINGYFKTLSNQGSRIAGIYNQAIIESFSIDVGQFYRVNTSINLASGNLSNHALFLTTLFRMGEMASATSQPYYTIGTSQQIEFDYQLQNDKVLSIKNQDQAVIPYQIPKGNKTVITIPESIVNAGVYSIISDQELINKIALNYNRLESDITFWNLKDLSSELQLTGLHVTTLSYEAEETIQKIHALTHKSVLWQYCLWIMLLFLSIEILLNKRW
jgi:hypothetical protein